MSILFPRDEAPLRRRYDWWVKYTLDPDLMNRASEAIRGEHDFTSFCGRSPKSTITAVPSTKPAGRWMGKDSSSDISADRFLHGMVRTLVGTMVDIGRGFIPLR